MDLPFEIASASPEAQQHYRKMIADGQTPRFAEMCALQIAPGIHGDNDSWMRGRRDGNWLDGLPKKQAQWMLREAKAAGIDTTGKYYMSGLADKRGHLDGEAWISDRDDVLRVAKKRKLELRGQVNYTPPEGVAPPQRAAGLNPKLVRELARKEMAAEPGLTRKAAEQRVRDRNTPHWKRKGK
jgi:hypothetical protein